MSQALEVSGDRTATLVRLFEQMDPAEVSELRAALQALGDDGTRT
jgi:hypothetical protein